MTIHSEHPFLPEKGGRDPVRRLRGRLTAAVSVWTAGSERQAVGLTVSSMMVADGESPVVLTLLDPDADFTERFAETRRAVINMLAWPQRDAAEMFAGLAPAPGGVFKHVAHEATAAGPKLSDAIAWAEVDWHDARQMGYALEVTCRLGAITIADTDEGLAHRRGRWLHVGSVD